MQEKAQRNITIRTNSFPRTPGSHYSRSHSLRRWEAAAQPTDEPCQRKPTLGPGFDFKSRDKGKERERDAGGGIKIPHLHVPTFTFHPLQSWATSRRGPLKSSPLNYPDDVGETLSWLQVPLWYRACWPFPHHTGRLCASLNAVWQEQHKGRRTDGSLVSSNYSSSCDTYNLMFCSEMGRHLLHTRTRTHTHTLGAPSKHGQTGPGVGHLFDWRATMGSWIWLRGRIRWRRWTQHFDDPPHRGQKYTMGYGENVR